MEKIKQILGRETRGLNLNKQQKEWFRIFSYNDVEKLMEELAKHYNGKETKWDIKE